MTQAINERYSELAESTCCLSCGGAINYSEVKAGETCVDLGSGRGTDVIRLAETVGAKGFVYGIDLAEGMIKKATETARKLGVYNVKFIQTKLEEIPILPQTVDVVISNCTINHAEDKQAVWHEIFRVLKEKGRFVVSDIYATKPVPEKYRNDPEAIAECWAGAITKEEYLDNLEVAGFSNITILEESQPYAKGEIEVCSMTIAGIRPSTRCCSCK